MAASLKALDGTESHRLQSLGDNGAESREGVVAVFPTKPLGHTPDVFDGVELRVELGQEVNDMGRAFKDLFKHGGLGLEVGLVREHVNGAAVERRVRLARPLLLFGRAVLGQAKRRLAPLVQNGLQALRHAVGVLHLLDHPDATGFEPAVLEHRCVLPAVLHVEQLGVEAVGRPLLMVHAVVEDKDTRDVRVERVERRERDGLDLVHEVFAPPPPVVVDPRCDFGVAEEAMTSADEAGGLPVYDIGNRPPMQDKHQSIP
jgi:hypothetical protein